MNVIHLTASTFHGGPERQMLGLAQALPPSCRTTLVSFGEGGRCRAFLDVARQQGVAALALEHDTPYLLTAQRELTRLLVQRDADVLCCHGYKANVLGRLAARQAGIPAVAVSRGWTGETWRVRFYDEIDRFNLRWMDHVVCVSQAQAARVAETRVPSHRVTVIRNAILPERFQDPDPGAREEIQRLFPRPRSRIVGAAGRLSPEKGFPILVDAAARAVSCDDSIGFVLFGDGPLRQSLAAQIAVAGLGESFVLAGFRDDLDRVLPGLDLLVLPSFTEGLPNVVLEAFAAQVPVVASAVGGVPEIVQDGLSGFLVPPGNSCRLAERILDVLFSEPRRREMGRMGQRRVLDDFTFDAQARQYLELFRRLGVERPGPEKAPPQELCASTR